MMNLVSPDLSLPLFLATRNRLKYDHPGQVVEYIQKKRLAYTKNCAVKKEEENKTQKRFKHLAGFYGHDVTACPTPQPISVKRGLGSTHPWNLPPNLYDVPVELFIKRRGAGGAHWKKIQPQKKRPLKKWRPQWKFYDMEPGPRIWSTCQKYKGVFLTNARERRATERLLISNVLSCYRDPEDPGPTHHVPELHSMQYNMTPVRKTKAPNPHLFLRNSCVPVRPNSIHPRHISFQPAPGRYEVRFINTCPCSSRLIYEPDIQTFIEREKRYKFRRLPYTKIRARKYCSPEWSHVKGRGFRYLFRKPPAAKKSIKRFKEVKKTEKHLQLYADARYLALINNPTRVPTSFRLEPSVELEPKVRYNCIAKRIMRRQLRNNKKIAFMSGQLRFKDAERPAILTVSALEKAKARLPVERQLREHPVTRMPMTQIQSKLSETPKHMMAAYELSLRKRLFKFLPLPGPKVLVTEKDTRPDMPEGVVYAPTPYYGKEIDPRDFLKPGADRKTISTGLSKFSTLYKPSVHVQVKTSMAVIL